MSPPRTNGSMLLDIFQTVGRLQGDMQQMLRGQDDARIERVGILTRLTNIELAAAKLAGERHVVRHAVNVVFGLAAGAAGAVATWLFHR